MRGREDAGHHAVGRWHRRRVGGGGNPVAWPELYWPESTERGHAAAHLGGGKVRKAVVDEVVVGVDQLSHAADRPLRPTAAPVKPADGAAGGASEGAPPVGLKPVAAHPVRVVQVL